LIFQQNISYRQRLGCQCSTFVWLNVLHPYYYSLFAVYSNVQGVTSNIVTFMTLLYFIIMISIITSTIYSMVMIPQNGTEFNYNLLNWVVRISFYIILFPMLFLKNRRYDICDGIKTGIASGLFQLLALIFTFLNYNFIFISFATAFITISVLCIVYKIADFLTKRLIKLKNINNFIHNSKKFDYVISVFGFIIVIIPSYVLRYLSIIESILLILPILIAIIFQRTKLHTGLLLGVSFASTVSFNIFYVGISLYLNDDSKNFLQNLAQYQRYVFSNHISLFLHLPCIIYAFVKIKVTDNEYAEAQISPESYTEFETFIKDKDSTNDL